VISFVSGDLLASDAVALVNPVNCVGVMGAGLAAQFKRAYPHNFYVYQAACRRGELSPGRVLAVKDGERWIVNVPTKRHWRDRSRFDDIAAGLIALVREVRARSLSSIAVPPLGCGLGGLPWDQVRPKIVDAFEALPDVRVLLFSPTD
jgi:O-acetyl-ADP-ribose deacetylase (regulator of RNase III)